jgi:chemotaxis protein methyltransferase CheR
VLKEMGKQIEGFRIEIIGTDLSTEVLEKAKSGIYSQFESSAAFRSTFWSRTSPRLARCGSSRRMCAPWSSSVPLNLLRDFSYLGMMDVIFCRNVLIYFDQATKTDVIDRLAKLTAPTDSLTWSRRDRHWSHRFVQGR